MAEIKKESKAKGKAKAKIEESAIKRQDDASTKVKMVEPVPAGVDNKDKLVEDAAIKRQDDVSTSVEMILLKQVGYLPMGSAIQVMPDKVDEYITSGKAKRRN